jgi:hypothetical protein
VRGLFDVVHLDPSEEGFGRLLDGMADIVGSAGKAGLDADSSAPSIATRLAVLVGSGGRDVLDDLEPALSSSLPDWRWRPDFPSAQFPELFWLMRNERLLDTLESLLGTEITCSPNYHMKLKLGSRDRDMAASIAAARGEGINRHELSNFLIAGASDWHADGNYGLPGSHRITAWIPITKATLENGCLWVAQGFGRVGHRPSCRSASGSGVTSFSSMIGCYTVLAAIGPRISSAGRSIFDIAGQMSQLTRPYPRLYRPKPRNARK